jgi:putative phosphonate metabolism protein
VSGRYALYYAPGAESALARTGSLWLGRDTVSGEPQQQPPIDGFPRSRVDAMTATARHYGFHATLKPPFALADGCTPEALDKALAAFARRSSPIAGLGLKVGELDGFVALVLSEESPAVRNLAATCVREFDAFRRPPSAEELERRRKASLSDLEEALLRRWGYPYVMEAFRFHMTLTDRLADDERQRIIPALRKLFGPAVTSNVAIDGISLFHQDDRTAPFRLIRHYPFGEDAMRRISRNVSTDRSSGPSLTSVRTSPPST